MRLETPWNSLELPAGIYNTPEALQMAATARKRWDAEQGLWVDDFCCSFAASVLSGVESRICPQHFGITRKKRAALHGVHMCAPIYSMWSHNAAFYIMDYYGIQMYTVNAILYSKLSI